MKSPHVLIAGLYHETHTFIAGETTLADCEIAIGKEIFSFEGDASPLGGALEVARDMGWEVVSALDIRAMPSAVCSDEILEFWWQTVQNTINEALKYGPLDGVFLALHGAMVSRWQDDVEGEMLARLRQKIGPKIPIGGVTDLHANFSQRMAQNSNCLVTYRENPHTDARESAVRAARLLDFLITSDERAQTYFRQMPILWPPTGTATEDSPMHDLEAMAHEIEKNDPEILAVNIHAGYSFADVYDAGVSFSVCSVGESKKAEKALDKLSALALKLKESGQIIDLDFESFVPRLKALLREKSSGPIVIAEPSDNIGGGAAGDGTGLLRALITHRIGHSAVIINDAAAVEHLQNLEIGDSTTLFIGGQSGFEGAGPLELKIELLERSNGEFELEDPQSHLASMLGDQIDMGPCVTLRHVLPNGEGLFLLLTSHKTPPFDLGQLRSQGLTPENLAIICVKAAVAHRRAYKPIAREMWSVSTAGPCSSNLTTLPFKKVRRPIFPLDEI